MQLSREFKIRCSAIGQIMTEPKTVKDREAGKLSKGCENYVHEWIKEQPEFYNRRFEFKSKYCEKGNVMENESIKYASKVYGWVGVKKNTTYHENEFLTGTPDIVLSDEICDIKNSWSQKTFPLFSNDIPVDGYGWQLQGYCDLFDKPKASLIYTLMDAPESLVDKEAYFKAKEMDLDEVPIEIYDEVKAYMSYSDLPDKLRIKRYYMDADKLAMESVYKKVEQIRNYIKSL